MVLVLASLVVGGIQRILRLHICHLPISLSFLYGVHQHDNYRRSGRL